MLKWLYVKKQIHSPKKRWQNKFTDNIIIQICFNFMGQHTNWYFFRWRKKFVQIKSFLFLRAVNQSNNNLIYWNRITLLIEFQSKISKPFQNCLTVALFNWRSFVFCSKTNKSTRNTENQRRIILKMNISSNILFDLRVK